MFNKNKQAAKNNPNFLSLVGDGIGFRNADDFNAKMSKAAANKPTPKQKKGKK